MEEDIKTFRVLLSGRVQGVGFRYFAENRAFEFNVKGYVRNTVDNKVEVVCQGLEKDIESFISDLKKGPAFSHVIRCEILGISSSEVYDSFRIKY